MVGKIPKYNIQKNLIIEKMTHCTKNLCLWHAILSVKRQTTDTIEKHLFAYAQMHVCIYKEL